MSALPPVGVSATSNRFQRYYNTDNGRNVSKSLHIESQSIIRKIRELNCDVESHSLLYYQHTNVTETENILHVAVITSNFYAGIPEKLSHEIKFIDI